MSSGGKKASTFIDDVFSTYLWTGEFTGNAGTTRQIANGIDLAGKGGLVWIKQRNQAYSTGHQLYDTVRGAGSEKEIDSSSTATEGAGNIEQYGWLNSFDSNGFTTKGGSADSDYVNKTGVDYTSWTFRKQKGFFDVVTYTGTGSARTIDHNLGCIPGMILVKRLNSTDNWNVYHQSQHTSNPAGYYLQLNTNDSVGGAANRWNNTSPTATEFTVGTAPVVNANGDTFVAYLFAVGRASESNCVNFDGTGDYLSLAASSDFTIPAFSGGSTDGNFTIEWWSYRDSAGGMSAFSIGNLQALGGLEMFFHSADGKVHIYTTTSGGGANRLISADTFAVQRWQHYALVRSGSTITLYFDGKSQGSWTESQSLGPSGNNSFTIGCSVSNSGPGALWNGYISNFRVTKGQALYATNFNPPDEPLTQTSQSANTGNVKLLCCNGSTTTASTVTPGTITANGDPTIQGSQKIFIDTKANIFGEGGEQNIIKCGSYIGKGNGPVEVNLGWEPQWVLVKNSSHTSQWVMFDSMRGVSSDLPDERLTADDNAAEGNFGANFLDFTSTGFTVEIQGNSEMNQTNSNHIFVAIRRPDPLVGKPAEAATDVFTVVNGDTDGDATTPWMLSPHIADFALFKGRNITHNWGASPRLTQGYYLSTNQTRTQSANQYQVFDFMNGFNNGTDTSGNYTGWLWKRHAGFDVVTFEGTNSAGLQIPHNLSKVPEMMWLKNRDATEHWSVYHKGLNGGSNPQDYALRLDTTSVELDADGWWNDTAPTATRFTVGNAGNTNGFQQSMIAFLFASVDGISSVGSYSGSSYDVTVTTGFTPRLVIVKKVNAGSHWHVFDSVRGMGASGNDGRLILNNDTAQDSSKDYVNTTATGFVMKAGADGDTNASGGSYIYYAHA